MVDNGKEIHQMRSTRFIKIWSKSFQKIILQFFLARFMQDLCKIFISCKKRFIFSARLARYVQDLVQDLASLARKVLSKFAHFLQDGFYWVYIAT